MAGQLNYEIDKQQPANPNSSTKRARFADNDAPIELTSTRGGRLIKRIVVGLVAAFAICLVSSSGAAFGATLCASHHGGQLRLIRHGGGERRETTVSVTSKADLNTLTARVALLESRAASVDDVRTLTARVATLESSVSSLQAANDCLETLLTGVTRSGNTLVFSHMNLQIESGSGSTDGAVNGLGNVIIGYNEFPGTQTGSHNLVFGHGQAFTSFGGIVAGVNNTISAPWASVLGGFDSQLERLFGVYQGARLLSRHHELEPRVQSDDPRARYRDVMAAVLSELATEVGRELPLEKEDVTGAIVASEVGSYKPALGHRRAFYEATEADRDRHVHVAQSHFHDIVPAHELGIGSVWINRIGERAEPAPTRELPDLYRLADMLDELVP
jgi:hypothetical protein